MKDNVYLRGFFMLSMLASQGIRGGCLQGVRGVSSVAARRAVPVFFSERDQVWKLFDQLNRPQIEVIDLTGWKERKVRLEVGKESYIETVVFPAKGEKHGFVPMENLENGIKSR